jgi:UDP-N-acetylglucosamine--N-acetylmuramyl-(pentapeptide) pyrophosphoryl-undecaprenol N-acetylglucosamine transferase
MEKFFPKEKIILTGNPVRQDIVNLINKREDALKHFGLSADKMTVLVIGGSLGAGTINESICNSLDIFANNNIQLVWQTGKFYFNAAENAVGKFKGKGIYAFEFINEMDFAYAVADIVISRAGAIAISELCAVKKPVILIPSPNVAEDHQTKNAMVLVNKNAALMIKDSDSKRLLGNAVLDLIYNTKKQNELMANIGSLAITDAADRIADEVFKLIHQPI